MPNQDVDNKSVLPTLREVTNDNAIDKFSQFADSLKDVPPDVAKNAIEQIPEFSITMLSMANGLRETLFNLTKQNADSTQKVYDACNKTLDNLQEMLLNDNLKFEEKKWIVEKYAEILRMMKEIDSDNKEFLLKVACVAGSVVLAVAGTFGGLLHKKKKPSILPWK